MKEVKKMKETDSLIKDERVREIKNKSREIG